METRFFNKINHDEKVFTKSSQDNFSKLEDEYEWMRVLSKTNDLNKYSPKDLSINAEDNSISMKYYPEGDLGTISFKSSTNKMCRILDSLFKILDNFRKKFPEFYCDPCDCSKIYLNKTIDRVYSIEEKFSFLLNLKYINGKELFNPFIHLGYIYKKCIEISDTSDIGLIHGDFFLSNILKDGKNFVLVDPRASFGAGFSMRGDRRYDLAKLRHSISGGYDLVINNKYECFVSKDSINYKLNFNYNSEKVTEYFDKKVEKLGYNINEIKFIEAILFLTMIPLHLESREHQCIFYAIACEKLGELYENWN